MPNKNKTGPLGQGPKTGRQMGNCEGAEPVVVGRGFGAGQGFRRGVGRGFGCRCGCRGGAGRGFIPVALSKEQETKILEAELAEIEAEKVDIQKQLKDLKD